MIYTVTIGLSAFLLFLVQPLVSKIILPWFGGGASIWLTSLVFFQTMLLAGYGGTHLLVRLLGLRRHIAFTALLLVLSLAFLPISVDVTLARDLPPSPALLIILLVSVGVPYFLLATTSPTLQYWIANDNRTSERNPYVEYGFSNLGSLLGLLAYPFLLELWLTTTMQTWVWSGLYVGYAVLLTTTIALFLNYNRERTLTKPALSLTGELRLRWLILAMIPSAMLMVVTHYLTIDVVNLPLLWVAPLCVYLVTFVLCFLKPSLSTPTRWRTIASVFAILGLVIADQWANSFGFAASIFWALTCLFAVGMICHGDLERAKPDKQDLTSFYLHVSAGGASGSILVGLVAPLLFDTTFEFELVLIIALYYIVASQLPLSKFGLAVFRSGVLASTIIAFLVNETALTGDTIHTARSFFSTYAVRVSNEGIPSRRLVAGTHVHGEQLRLPEFEHLPVAYYHESTGLAHIARLTDPKHLALIGLGVGSAVEYAGAGDTVDIYELDPTVVDIATNYFTVLSDSPASVKTIIGDGRVQLRQARDAHYDLIVLDAFTSGSIPTHLLTVEALQEVLDKLAPDGVIAFHISNQHVDLLPVLHGVADALDLAIFSHESHGQEELLMLPATWVMLTPSRAVAERVARATPGWQSPPPEKIVWRDDYSNIWSVLR